MRPAPLALVLVLATGVVGACGSDGAPSGGEKVAETACGFEIGDVICDAPFEGHVRNASTGLASEQPYGPFSLTDVLAMGPQRYAFIHTTSFW